MPAKEQAAWRHTLDTRPFMNGYDVITTISALIRNDVFFICALNYQDVQKMSDNNK